MLCDEADAEESKIDGNYDADAGSDVHHSDNEDVAEADAADDDDDDADVGSHDDHAINAVNILMRLTMTPMLTATPITL